MRAGDRFRHHATRSAIRSEWVLASSRIDPRTQNLADGWLARTAAAAARRVRRSIVTVLVFERRRHKCPLQFPGWHRDSLNIAGPMQLNLDLFIESRLRFFASERVAGGEIEMGGY